MIIVEDLSMFDEMQNRVDAIQPKMKVQVISFSFYRIQSETDRSKYYDVYVTINNYGKKVISCDCWPGRLKKICTHATVALGVYMKFIEKAEVSNVEEENQNEKVDITKAPYMSNTNMKLDKIGNFRV